MVRRSCALQHISPPLEPDQPRHGTGYRRRAGRSKRTGQFRMERQQHLHIGADRGWQKTRAQSPIRVRTPHSIFQIPRPQNVLLRTLPVFLHPAPFHSFTHPDRHRLFKRRVKDLFPACDVNGKDGAAGTTLCDWPDRKQHCHTPVP